MILLDTNILLRDANPADLAFATVGTAIDALHAQGEVLCVVPQNLYEFWAAATRPLTANGLGLTVVACQVQLGLITTAFRFLPDMPTLYAEWEALVVAHACHGRVSFDARLVAAMRTDAVTRTLTRNGSDFARFPGVVVIDPVAVAGPPIPPWGHAP